MLKRSDSKQKISSQSIAKLEMSFFSKTIISLQKHSDFLLVLISTMSEWWSRQTTMGSSSFNLILGVVWG